VSELRMRRDPPCRQSAGWLRCAARRGRVMKCDDQTKRLVKRDQMGDMLNMTIEACSCALASFSLDDTFADAK
jgi:hypothetical protein